MYKLTTMFVLVLVALMPMAMAQTAVPQERAQLDCEQYDGDLQRRCLAAQSTVVLQTTRDHPEQREVRSEELRRRMQAVESRDMSTRESYDRVARGEASRDETDRVNFANLVHRFRNLRADSAKLSTIINTIENRIAHQQEQGYDVSHAQRYIDNARIHLDTSLTRIERVSGFFEARDPPSVSLNRILAEHMRETAETLTAGAKSAQLASQAFRTPLSEENPVWVATNGYTVSEAHLHALMAAYGSCPEQDVCQWDLNNDGVVNVQDLLILLAHWDEEGPSIVEASQADLNGDGVINTFDLLIMLDNFGPCASEQCVGDLNQDGVVDETDVQLLLSLWGHLD